MKIVRAADSNFAEQIRELTASSSLFDSTIEQRTREIIEAVKLRGDAALSEFTERFDGAKLSPEQFAITRAEMLAASLKADDALRAAVAVAGKNIETFSRKGLRKNWSMRNSHGGSVGEKYDPFQRVGIYIPGGTAPLVS
ncbi:MAG: histidinol dehydrogenase, partial [Verrucomicrobiota bacterium]